MTVRIGDDALGYEPPLHLWAGLSSVSIGYPNGFGTPKGSGPKSSTPPAADNDRPQIQRAVARVAPEQRFGSSTRPPHAGAPGARLRHSSPRVPEMTAIRRHPPRSKAPAASLKRDKIPANPPDTACQRAWIAPRRSPVRVRLAPFREVPARGGLLLVTNRRAFGGESRSARMCRPASRGSGRATLTSHAAGADADDFSAPV
jgi:hypothetical protein